MHFLNGRSIVVTFRCPCLVVFLKYLENVLFYSVFVNLYLNGLSYEYNDDVITFSKYIYANSVINVELKYTHTK